MDIKCPLCKSVRILSGTVVPTNPDETSSQQVGFGVCFVPRNARPVRQKQGVHLMNASFVCLECGHLWTKVEPGKVRDFIQSHGSELVKQHVKLLEAGVAYDLPPSLDAQEIGRKVAEIDALVMAGQQGEASRRFREMMICPWDTAIEATRDWATLTREKKLAKFGWVSKEKPLPHHPELLRHPMRDPELDG